MIAMPFFGKIKQLFCKHDYEQIAKHESAQCNLWKCKKCNVYYIQHYGIRIGYKCIVPNIGGWENLK